MGRGLRAGARGFTLIELTVSLGVVALVLAATGAVLSISSRLWPSRSDPTSARTQSAAALAELARDLAAATRVISVSATAIEIEVPDRDDDNAADKLAYAWGGAGSALTRRLNTGTPVAVTPVLAQFSIAADIAESVIVSSQTTTGSQEIVYFANAADTTIADISSLLAVGQCFTLNLPAGAQSALVGSVDIEMRRGLGGSVLVSLRDAQGDVPGNATLASATVADSAMSPSVTWQRVNFTNPATVRPGQRVCVTVEWASGITPAGVAVQPLTTPPAGSWAVRRVSLLPWATQTNAMMGIRVRAAAALPTSTTTERRVDRVAVRALPAGQQGRGLAVDVTLPNRPAAP